jgi:hypothetical protein
MIWFNIAGIVLTLLMGCLGLFFPNRASQLTGLEARTPPGFSEFRATFGGALVFGSVFALVTLSPIAFLSAGLWWAGAAFGRVVSIFADKSSTAKNWAAVVFESVAGASLMIGAPFAAMVQLLN